MSSSTKHRVLLPVGDASETVDTLYPYFRLIEAGFQPVVAGPERRSYQMVLHEVREGWTITREWEGYRIDAEVAFSEVDPDDFLGVFYSGGRAPEYIREDPHLIAATQRFFDAGVPIASVCHGVEIPAQGQTASGAGGWRPSPSAASISRFAAASTWMRPASWTAISSLAGRSTTTGRTWGPGSACSKRPAPEISGPRFRQPRAPSRSRRRSGGHEAASASIDDPLPTSGSPCVSRSTYPLASVAAC
jgi:putative intracellular protease/amidase